MKNRFLSFCNKPQNVFWFGMLITLIATSLEVFRGRCTNYYDYQDSTRMFLEGISEYTVEYAYAHEIYFLYTPVFSILFAPIFILPWWLGPYVWNIANYSLFFLSIWTLPRRFWEYRVRMIWFLLPVLLQAIFCYQYNTVVAYLFVFAFSLLERGKGFWAVLLIMISACTKVYGGAELALLFCYPKTWRNFGYAVVIGAILLALPLLNFNFENPMSLYTDMLNMISSHHSDSDFVGILFARGLKPFLLPNYRLVQVGLLVLLAIGFFANYKRWKSLYFRTCCMAVLSGYIILFSDCPETHTYIISFPGYVMAFWLQPNRKWYDWVLFWSLVVNFGVLPTDVLCPRWLHEYIHENYWLDVYTYALCWIRVVWWAIEPKAAYLKNTTKGAVALLLLSVVSLSASAQNKQQPRPAQRVVKVNGVSFTMKYVQGGSYIMGAQPNDTLADDDEKPRHKVIVNSFYIGENEMTQDIWEAVMGKNKCKIKGAKQPVDYVTYEDCQEFIEKLNSITHLNFRLPTEAEWEYAARGGRKSKGYLYSGSNDILECGWIGDECVKWDGHVEVKKKKPNELGLYDMSGNVWEWCEDYYGKFTSDTQTNPCNKKCSWFHVIRGGGYNNSARYSRITNRYMFDTRRRWVNTGFRLALSVK